MTRDIAHFLLRELSTRHASSEPMVTSPHRGCALNLPYLGHAVQAATEQRLRAEAALRQRRERARFGYD